jgi:hypothetical protein
MTLEIVILSQIVLMKKITTFYCNKKWLLLKKTVLLKDRGGFFSVAVKTSATVRLGSRISLWLHGGVDTIFI